MPRWPTVSQERIARMRELRSQGRFMREVALEVGLEKKAVRDYLHPEIRVRRNAHRRKYRELKRLGTIINGERCTLKVRKRPKPELCELCGGTQPFCWHHWNNNHFEWGLWLCRKCHRFVGGIELGLGPYHIGKYIRLKEEIEGG
mgnify:FL=1